VGGGGEFKGDNSQKERGESPVFSRSCPPKGLDLLKQAILIKHCSASRLPDHEFQRSGGKKQSTWRAVAMKIPSVPPQTHTSKST